MGYKNNNKDSKLVDNSMDLKTLKEEFKKTKELLKDNNVLEQKIKEIEKKVEEYKNQLLKEVLDLNNDVISQFNQSFAEVYDYHGKDLKNKFYHLITEVYDKVYFWGDDFNKFVENLEKNYNQKFEVLTLKSQSTKDFDEYEDYERYTVKKYFYVNLIVPKSMKEIIARKYKDIKEKDLEVLCSKENIFLIDKEWVESNDYHLDNEIDLTKVFAHLDVNNSFNVKKLNNCNPYNNLYYKNDERFENSIFETLEYYNEKIKKEDAKENKKILDNYKKQLEKEQKRYEEMLEKM